MPACSSVSVCFWARIGTHTGRATPLPSPLPSPRAGEADQWRSQRPIGPVRRPVDRPALREGHSGQARLGAKPSTAGSSEKYGNMLNFSDVLAETHYLKYLGIGHAHCSSTYTLTYKASIAAARVTVNKLGASASRRALMGTHKGLDMYMLRWRC